MNQLKVYENPLDASKIYNEQTDNVLRRFLEIRAQFPQARIYEGVPCPKNDITPFDKQSAIKLLEKSGNFEIVCHAGEPATWAIGAAIASAVLSVGVAIYTYLNMPKLPEALNRSSNNELSDRTNKVRLKGRVADIFGTAKSVPDLIAPPILYYNNFGIEIEDCLMCVGRGYYQIQDIKDGNTLGSTIDGFSASFYEPNMSLVGTPQIRIGEEFTEAPLVGKKSEAITGQSLAQGSESVIPLALENGLYPQYPNRIYSTNGGFNAIFTVGEAVIIDADTIGMANASIGGNANVEMTGVITIATTQNIENADSYKKIQINTLLIEDVSNGFIDLAGLYDVADIVKTGSYVYEITLSNFAISNPNWTRMTADNSAALSANLTASELSINIDGQYPSILAVTDNYIELEIPVSMQPEWDKLNEQTVRNVNIDISKYTSDWLGWFYFENKDIEELIFNFYLPQGIYSIGTNGKIYEYNVGYTIEYQEVINGNPVDEVFSATFFDWNKSTDAIGLSRRFTLDHKFPKGVRFRLKKEADIHVKHKTNRINDLKIKSVYACARLQQLTYDDVTLVRSRTVATDGALSIKERQLNCIVTRKLHTYRNGYQSIDRYPTSNFADIVCAMTADKLIGNRDISTLDIAELYRVADEVNDYFSVSIGFNYTFDNPKLSYEETLRMIANAVFCADRRESNVVTFTFEKPKTIPTLLFNHRNIIPLSRTESVKFGVNRDYDGVELSFVDPQDSWSESKIMLPNDQIINPQKIEVPGVTSYEQAYLLAYRAYNKQRLQRKAIDFTGYHEVDLIGRDDLIMCANETRSHMVSSGVITDQDGLIVELSQPCILVGNDNYIHITLPNRQVESIRVTQVDEYHLLLARAPSTQLVVEYEGNIACSNYIVTTESNARRSLYLITEKTTSKGVTAINYNDGYYQNDHDFV